jgi:hypothetical protein
LFELLDIMTGEFDIAWADASEPRMEVLAHIAQHVLETIQ